MLLEMEGELEDIRKIYRDVANEEMDPAHGDYVMSLVKESQLTKQGLRKLIVKIG